MPDTADVTWTEVFMMVNITYQASVMLIIFCSYSRTIAGAVDRWAKRILGCIHPDIRAQQVEAEQRLQELELVQAKRKAEGMHPSKLGLAPRPGMKRERSVTFVDDDGDVSIDDSDEFDDDYEDDSATTVPTDEDPTNDDPLAPLTPTAAAHKENDSDDNEHDNEANPNVDWIGRWIIVPSYVAVMTTLLALGATIF
jgi:hypothetical protein